MQIFRCWVIYNRNWSVVALPLVLWLGTIGKPGVLLVQRLLVDVSLASGIMTIQIEATLTSGQSINSSHLVPFVTTMLCLTLGTNIITTCTTSIQILLMYVFNRQTFRSDRISYLESSKRDRAGTILQPRLTPDERCCRPHRIWSLVHCQHYHTFRTLLSIQQRRIRGLKCCK